MVTGEGRARSGSVPRGAPGAVPKGPPVLGSIRPGQVLKLPEALYLYGVGELTIRVTRVGMVGRLADGEWLPVAGVEIAWNGKELGVREVLVHLDGLARLRRRP